MTSESVQDFFVPFTMYRCFSCGLLIDWKAYQNRLACKAKGVAMPKFLSEESKQEWIAKVRATKAAKKKKENDPTPILDDEETAEIINATPLATQEKDAELQPGTAVIAIDSALATMDRERTILQQARAILSGRGYATVHP